MYFGKIRKYWSWAALALAIAFIVMLTFSTTKASAGALTNLNGEWRGWSTACFAPKNEARGQKDYCERIRCKVIYSGSGTQKNLNITCGTRGSKIEGSASLRESGNQISGRWSENITGASGTVSGSSSGNTINARVRGGAFTASLTIKTTGVNQRVTLKPRGLDLKSVTMSLRKR